MFRVVGDQGIFDLRSLPFGWKLCPPICAAVVGRHLQTAFSVMPGSPDDEPGSIVNCDPGARRNKIRAWKKLLYPPWVPGVPCEKKTGTL